MNIYNIYKKSLYIRIFEEKLDYLFKKGLINGTAHFCIGQEYIPVIVSHYLNKNDFVTSTHRGHGHALAKGLDPAKLLAELVGKQTGYNSGKGGSQHIISKEYGYFANGITGGMIPIATGLAFAIKYQNKNNLIVAYLGDGAFNEGYVQESLNLAVIWQLPILFICENNQYAMSTPYKKTHGADIYQRAKSIGIISELIRDNDYEMFDKVVQKYINDIKKKSKPYFIEIQTYRHLGHSKNDKNLYRNHEEEEKWFKTDVLKKLEKEITTKNQCPQKKLNQLKNKYETEIEKLIKGVLTKPVNEISKIYNHLYTK